MKANEDTSELKKLSEKEIFVKEETENKGWQFLETRLSLLLKQYKNTDSVSLVSLKKIMLCWWKGWLCYLKHYMHLDSFKVKSNSSKCY